MAGEARTQSFLLGSGTVMIGAVADLYNLTPTKHSIGLVKNFQVTAEPNYIDLTQGVKATIIFQVKTANPVKAQCEVYEYTAQNMAYALGLEGLNILSPVATYVLAAPIVGSTTTPVATLSLDGGSTPPPIFPAGSWFCIQDPVFLDHVQYVQSSADSTNTSDVATVTLNTETTFKLGNSFPAGSIITPVNAFAVGSKKEEPYHSVMVTSTLPQNNVPVSILFPKVRITRGFSLTFGETNFGNMPFQFTPFELLPTDLFYMDFLHDGFGKLMSAS